MKEITSQTYFKWFQNMFFWRRFEDKCRFLYLKKKIRGFLHLYNGQEAIPAGVSHAMDLTKDQMITAYRCHILSIALGVVPQKVLAELLGKITGTSRGMGGSMHLFDKEKRFYGGYGIVGGQIPLGAGIAFANKYFNRKYVTITLLGDGAVRQGSLHETFNMSMTWKLPVVFICENNRYAMSTSIDRSTNLKEIYKIGYAYDMPSYPVEGMDPAKVAKAANLAIERARLGKGPSFLDVRTYRYRGHSISDSETYRSKEEVEQYKKQDPILRVKKLILINQWASEKQLEYFEEKAKSEVESSVLFEGNSHLPKIEQMYELVSKQKNYPFVD
ncbi:MAG TPA: pyruvate dehydrogenase (acetyl-transferring) E1 component subunit alpha [Blattabacteriaceae bacterium]